MLPQANVDISYHGIILYPHNHVSLPLTNIAKIARRTQTGDATRVPFSSQASSRLPLCATGIFTGAARFRFLYASISILVSAGFSLGFDLSLITATGVLRVSPLFCFSNYLTKSTDVLLDVKDSNNKLLICYVVTLASIIGIVKEVETLIGCQRSPCAKGVPTSLLNLLINVDSSDTESIGYGVWIIQITSLEVEKMLTNKSSQGEAKDWELKSYKNEEE
ncbi:hypothetical protein LXL04_013534 [Taraxacum kok-saghyz]